MIIKPFTKKYEISRKIMFCEYQSRKSLLVMKLVLYMMHNVIVHCHLRFSPEVIFANKKIVLKLRYYEIIIHQHFKILSIKQHQHPN